MAKRCEIGLRLLLVTNRKWHIGFQMTWKSSTLYDLEGHWQPVRSAILATAGLLLLQIRRCWLFRRRIGEVICRNRSATRPSALCSASCWNSVRTMRKFAPRPPRTNCSKSTRSILCASPWRPSSSWAMAAFASSRKEPRKSFSKGRSVGCGLSARFLRLFVKFVF